MPNGYGHTKSQECTLYEKLKKELSRDGRLMHIGRLLEYAYKKYCDNVALIYKEQRITYKELYYRAGLMTKKVRQAGVKPKDRVLLFFENSLEFYIGYYGILQAGAVVAPLNTFLCERELEHIVNDAQPTLIIASQKLSKFLRNTGIKILTEDDMQLTPLVPENIEDVAIIDLDEQDMSVLLYTSGTTGLPKGVMLSSKNCMTNVVQMIARVGLWQGERIFGVLPLFHSFAQSICVWATLFVGCTVIVVPNINRRDILQGLEQKPTFFCGVPALYGLLCLLKTAPLDSVKCFVSGGDALSDKIRAAFALIYGRKICNGYGLTETAPLVSVDLRDQTELTSNVGRAVCGITTSIRDERGNVLLNGEIGELWVKGDNVMLGYYNESEMTAKVLTDGWLHTGDLAYIDKNNTIVITGRVKDLIIHKGFNIYPQEIENIIMSHASVIRTGVIGRNDPQVGQVPIAYVQLREEQEGIEQELKKICLQNLAAYKVPKQFIITVKDLPVTATGKVNKKKLQSE